MGGIGGAISSFGWIFLLGAGVTLYQLRQHWGEFRAGELSARTRQLAGGVAFFILVPVGVLLHELGHMLAAWSTGSQVLGLHYFLFWGYVEYVPSSQSALLEWYVSLAGNFGSYALGIASIAAAMYLRNAKPVRRVILMQLGLLELVQTLIAYPLMSLDPGFVGDWNSIYSFRAPVASTATLAVHILSLAAFIYLVQANRRAKYLLGTAPAPAQSQPL